MPELMREGMFETVAVVEVGMPTAGRVMGALYSFYFYYTELLVPQWI